MTGVWPGLVTFRRGWGLARARPWNDQADSSAALRLERGSDRFLADCASWLSDLSVTEVLSPALPTGQSRVWRRAGFQEHLELVVYERPLSNDTPPQPILPVSDVSHPDLRALAHIDDRAFPPRWRVGHLGLSDAVAATPHSKVLIVGGTAGTSGFAIIGEMAGVAYLQRLSVDPDQTGKGVGRSLVRASVAWAQRVGARTMLLNTQPENHIAASLYLSEGFATAGPRLQVMIWTGRPKESEPA
ncbi:hypothetical protein BH23ACT5_BH23ACT5_07200 [soil metagenome]